MTLAVDIAKSWPGFDLSVAFEAPAGVSALFGPSGAGKTSVARAVAGLLRPDRGRITLDGADLSALPPHRRGVGYVFQEPRLFPHMTVARNIGYGGPPDPELIELLGIAPLMDRRPGALSGGEAQRVAIARALAAAPRIVVMDEPLSALDAPRRDEVLPWLERLRDARRVPILYVSHAMEEVARLADWLVVIDGGRVRRAGAAEEVLSDPALVSLIGPRQAGARLSGKVTELNRADGLARVSTPIGPLIVPGRAAALGAPVRLRIPAADVILATARPEGLSALNVLPVTVLDLSPSGTGMAVALRAGSGRLLAHVTARSAVVMGLAPGQEIFAIVKATAVAA